MKLWAWFKAYASVFVLRFRVETQYRAAAMGAIVCQMCFGLMSIALYRTLYTTQPQALPLSNVVTYVWIQQAFFRMLLSSDGELLSVIRTGGMAYELCRPMSPYSFYYVRAMAQKVVSSGLRAFPMLIIAAILPQGWAIGGPAGAWQLAVAFVSILAGLLCVCALDNIAMAFTIRTLDNQGISALLALLMTTFSGNILPLTLFPDAWQKWLRFSPYAQILDGPIRIYTGECTLAASGEILAVQLIWAVLLVLLGQWMWRKNQKRMIMQGG